MFWSTHCEIVWKGIFLFCFNLMQCQKSNTILLSQISGWANWNTAADVLREWFWPGLGTQMLPQLARKNKVGGSDSPRPVDRVMHVRLRWQLGPSTSLEAAKMALEGFQAKPCSDRYSSPFASPPWYANVHCLACVAKQCGYADTSEREHVRQRLKEQRGK